MTKLIPAAKVLGVVILPCPLVHTYNDLWKHAIVSIGYIWNIYLECTQTFDLKDICLSYHMVLYLYLNVLYIISPLFIKVILIMIMHLYNFSIMIIFPRILDL